MHSSLRLFGRGNLVRSEELKIFHPDKPTSMNTGDDLFFDSDDEDRVYPDVVHAKYDNEEVELRRMSKSDLEEYYKRCGFEFYDTTALYRFKLVNPSLRTYAEGFSFNESSVFRNLEAFNLEQTSETKEVFDSPSLVCIPVASSGRDISAFFKNILKRRLSNCHEGEIDNVKIDNFFDDIVWYDKERTFPYAVIASKGREEKSGVVDYIKPWEALKRQMQIEQKDLDMDVALDVITELYASSEPFLDKCESSHEIRTPGGIYYVLFDKPTILTYKNPEEHSLRDIVNICNEIEHVAEYISETEIKVGSLIVKIL